MQNLSSAKLETIKDWYANLHPAKREEVKAHMARKLAARMEPWPKEYVSNVSGKIYIPHNEEERFFVYNDTPKNMLLKGGEGAGKSVAGIIKDLERLRRGMNGILVCVSGDTLVNNIPIAECNTMMRVNTLQGTQTATPSFLEGRGDLFHVVTQSGHQVTVTSNHRFLTPIGFCQLRDLRVGALIAIDDNKHELTCLEKLPDFQDCCLRGFHPYDEYANPLVQCDLDRLQQLVLLILDTFCDSVRPSHVYTDNSFFLSFLVGVVKESLPLFCSYEGFRLLFDVFSRFLLLAFQIDSHPKSALYLSQLFVDNADEMLTAHFPWLPLIQAQENNQAFRQSPQVLNLHPKVSKFLNYQKLSSYSYYNATYSKIANITFQKEGEFYGLSVPSVGHYSANGIFHHNSPDLEHFKKSLWPEFKRWCPIHRIIERHQYRFEEGWEPSSAFTLVFINELGGYSSLVCGGIKESEAISWEGPNVSFAHFDEARRHRTAIALKTLSGRVRIPGPNNEPPQIYFTTTPRKHWLFEYFGPIIARCKNCNAQYEIINNEETICPECDNTENIIEDENLNFKRNSFVATVLTEENKDNLSDDFTQERGESLNEAEKRILLLAEWEDETDTEKFIQSAWWKQCEEDLPPLSRNEAAILVLDASKGGSSQLDYDVFGLVIVTRHPSDNEKVAVRYVNYWKPPPKGLLDYAPIELEVRKLCTEYSIIEVAYDPWQLHDMCTRLKLEKFAFFREFPQGKSRELADKRLQDVIMSRRIAYDKITGYHELARHLDNADYKKDSKGAIRLVKRKDTLKIDLAVCLSMGVDRCYYYNL